MENQKNHNIFQSDRGFSVEILWPTGICYREGGRQLTGYSEILVGSKDIALFKSSIKFWSMPHASEAINGSEKERIVGNIRDLLLKQGIQVQVLDF